MRFIAILLCALSVTTTVLRAQSADLDFERVIDGLDEPWAVAELPDGALLVTERGGTLWLARDGVKQQVTGGPQVRAQGQGGLLDVTLPRDFPQTGEVLLTYSKPQGRGSGTALAVAQLSADRTRLTGLRDLFISTPGGSGGRHFGSRVVEAPDGTLFVTIGDRGDADSAQDRASPQGSIIRINRDGSVPADNPFVGQTGIQPEIWSFGHRNPQGAALDMQGQLWTAEHGARGGDEVNRIRAGANYGWPVISYGRHYSGARIGEGTAKAGMEQPEHYWDPSIAPSGMMIYAGDMFPDWRGDIFVGSLKFDYIARLSGQPLREIAQISAPPTERVRDIIEARDGSILFVSVGTGSIWRIVRR